MGWMENGGGWWSQKSAHRWGEWNVAKRERGPGGPGIFRGEREVKDSLQGCSMGADGEEMEAVVAREGRKRRRKWQLGVKNCGQWLDQEGREEKKEVETGKGSLKTIAWSWRRPKAPRSSCRQGP